jgi:hypothetical protein
MDLEGYRARVFTFGYDSKVSGSESDAGISDYARQFLWDVHQARTLDPREVSTLESACFFVLPLAWC